MKKYIALCAFAALLCACSTSKKITYTNAEMTEKQLTVIEDNSLFPTASVVGGGAHLADAERAKIEEQNRQKRFDKFNSINGITFTKEGTDSLKASIQNEILFRFDSYEVNAQAKNMLIELASVIKEEPGTKVSIIGHTDNIGEKDYNIVLSHNRASAVGNILREAGVPSGDISETGKGYSLPIADNSTEDGRAKNRRVELIISDTAK